MRVLDFKVIVKPDDEIGGYTAVCPSLQGCSGHGETVEEAIAGIEKAILTALGSKGDQIQPVTDDSRALVGNVFILLTEEAQSGQFPKVVNETQVGNFKRGLTGTLRTRFKSRGKLHTTLFLALTAIALSILGLWIFDGFNRRRIAPVPVACVSKPADVSLPIYFQSRSIGLRLGEMTIDSEGKLYFSGLQSGQIYRLSSEKKLTTFASLGQNWTNGLVSAPKDVIYATSGPAIHRIDKNGTHTLLSWLEEGVEGLIIGPDGKLYTVCFTKNVCRVDAANGNYEIFLTLPARVASLAFNSEGNLYSSGWSTNSIYKTLPDGSTSIFAEGVSRPLGLTIDEEDNIYVASVGEGKVVKIRPDGRKLDFVTGLCSPRGLLFDGNGYLLISDDANPDGGTIYRVHASVNGFEYDGIQ